MLQVRGKQRLGKVTVTEKHKRETKEAEKPLSGGLTT